ncbi:PDZ domain-containing protein [bacterium]|nr:PDZ domain-containing protein [bacterium]
MNPVVKRWWLVLLTAIFAVSGLTFTNALAEEEEEIEVIITDEPGDKAFLGIYPSDLSEDKGEDGVLIEEVVEDGPAQEAGIKAGDIIVKLGDNKVTTTKELRKVLGDLKPGDDLAIVVVREEEELDFKVILDQHPKEAFILKSPEFHTLEAEKCAFLGVETETLEGQLAKYFDVKYGALVEEVGEDTPAEKAGIKAGDVIVKIDDDDIESTRGLVRVIRSHDPETKVTVKVIRKGKKKKFKATLAEKSFSGSGKMFKKTMIFCDDDDDILDFHKFIPDNLECDIKEAVQKAVKCIKIQTREGCGDMQEQMEELEEEMKRLNEEMKELKEAK